MRQRSFSKKKSFIKILLGFFYHAPHRVVACIRRIDKKCKSNIYCNVALLYGWVVVFGLFSPDYSFNPFVNLWQSFLYLFTNRDGFLFGIFSLSPFVVMVSLHGRKKIDPRIYWIKLLFFLPLMNVIFHYQFFLRDYFDFWGFWFSLVISFYGAFNIAILHQRPLAKNLPPLLLAIKKIDDAIAKYFYQPLGKAIDTISNRATKYFKK